MADGLVDAGELIASLLARPAYAFDDVELVALFDAAGEHVRLAQALQAFALGEIDARGLPIAQGATSTTVWARERQRVSNRSAAAQVGLAKALPHHPLLAAGLHQGLVNPEQAQVIAKAVAEIPAEAGPAVREKAERELIAWAGQHGPEQLRLLGARILHHVAPELADRRDADALARAEKRAAQTRAFTMTPDTLGRVRLHGWLGSEAAACVAAAIEPLCTPAGQEDDRSPAQRRADALTEVCRLSLATGDLPGKGGEAARVVVVLPFADLAASVGSGLLDNGDSITAEAVRRMACCAGIIPAVLDSHGVPIDLGRERRLFTGAARRALVLRDGGCAFPGCDRPARWSEGHHVVSWLDGGPTDLANGCAPVRPPPPRHTPR